MVSKTLARFEVKYLQILNESGIADLKLMPKLSTQMIKRMYELMVYARAFDEKALKLQRQGKMGTYAAIKGQEACQIGSALAMNEEDFVFPSFRVEGVYLSRGMPAELLLQYWAGDERGMLIPKNINMFPLCITVGEQPLHAVGMAMAKKMLKQKGVVITYFGDGGTSEGDLHEAMNFAGVYRSPVLFICQNNQWAISVPVKEQTASQTLAQKAIAYGFEGIQIDGNDVFAAYQATQDALKKIRSGSGPIFIECLTYRIADHTTSDDAARYRKSEEVLSWGKKDPIERLKKYMKEKKIFSEKYGKSVLENAQSGIDLAAEKMLKMRLYEPAEIFNYMFADLTPELVKQREELLGEIATLGDTTVRPQGKPTDNVSAGVVGELEVAKDEQVKETPKKTKKESNYDEIY